MVLGKDQPQYQPLPVFRDDGQEGSMVQCWELNDEEIAELIRTRRIWISQMTFGAPLQPISVSVAPLVWITEPDGKVRAPDSDEVINTRTEVDDKELEELEEDLFGENGEIPHNGHTCDPKKWDELIEENNRRKGYIREIPLKEKEGSDE